MPTFLEAKGLQMRFGGVHAIRDVDLSLSEGDVHCLIGPNGAGKSTFFKMVSGLYRPTAGSITFLGMDITGKAPFRIARLGLGIKSQVPQLFDELTPHEHVWLAARRNREIDARARTDAILEELMLDTVAHKPVGLLAHGIRQWVEIATVIAPKPRLVLLDEPAAGMSDTEVDRTAALVRTLKANHSLLVVEHDMRFIEMIADRVTVFHQGEVFLDGSARDVLSDRGVQDIYLGKGLSHDA